MSLPHVVVYGGVYLDYGGIEHALLQLIEAFSSRYQFTVMSAASPSFQAKLQQLGADCHEIPINSLFSLSTILHTAQSFRECQADLVHTLDARGSVTGALAAKLVGLPVIHRHQVSPLDYEKNTRLKTFFFHLGEALLGWFFISEGIFVGEKVRRRYVRRGLAPAWRSHYIPYSVDNAALEAIHQQRAQLRQNLGLAESDFLWVNIGRLNPQKAQHVILDAAALLPREEPWQIWIGGGGELEGALIRQIKSLGLAERVRLLGVLSPRAAHEYLAAADALVFPSLYENMPITVLEAMALQTPSIVTDVGDSWYMSGDPSFLPQAASLLVPLNDSAALAAQMCRLMKDVGLYQRLKEGCQIRSREFFPARTLEQIEQLFREVLAG